jgi:hypothetical protein
MNKNRKIIILGSILLAVGIAVYRETYRSQKTLANNGSDRNGNSLIQERASSRKSPATRICNPVKDFINAYKTPVEFYGKVIDQHGNAVSGALIKILPVTNAFGTSDSSSDFEITSDEKGLFSVNNMKALSIGIQVTKEGYLSLGHNDIDKPASSRSIDYGLSDSKGERFKDPNNPTLFTLHKIGSLEPMVYVDNQRWKLAVDGTVRKIAMDTVKGVGVHQIEFRFKSNWNQLPMDNKINDKRYDWSFQAHIPGGGFIKNDSDYNFEAPKGGYVDTIKFEYSATMSKKDWKKFRYGRYFVKFEDGTHGRIRFSVNGSSDMSPLLMTSWMNLKPGSRNLASPDKDSFGMPDE